MSEKKEFEDFLNDSFSTKEENSIVQAVVEEIIGEDVYFSFGGKSEAKIPLSEFPAKPKKGDVLDIFLIYHENSRGEPVASYLKALQIKERGELKNVINEGKPVEGTVLKADKKGVFVKYKNLVGLIPYSSWSNQKDIKPEDVKETNVSFYIEKIVNNSGKKAKKGEYLEDFIADRKKFLINEYKIKKEKALAEIKVGDIIEGKVKNITEFGAFIDLGGVDGLLKLNEISWVRINKVEDVLSVGDKVKVKVIDFDKETKKISVSMKQLEEKPWDKFINKYKENDIINGVVVEIISNGAFIKIIDGVDAFLKISDMSWTKRINHPNELLKIGQKVEVMITKIDTEAKKVNVSLKHLLENPWDKAYDKYKVGTKVSGKVKNIADFGAFIELEEGIDALIPKNDISWTEDVDPKKYFTVGDIVNGVVTYFNDRDKKIKVGIKQLEKNPWDNIPEKYKEGEIVEFKVKDIDLEKGLLVEFTKEIDSYIPLKEISSGKIEDIKASLKDKFKAGDIVKAVIKELDKKNRNILLSIREYDKIIEKKSVQGYLKSGKEEKFTLGDLLKNKVEKSNSKEK